MDDLDASMMHIQIELHLSACLFSFTQNQFLCYIYPKFQKYFPSIINQNIFLITTDFAGKP